jgi:hypothetical protein
MIGERKLHKEDCFCAKIQAFLSRVSRRGVCSLEIFYEVSVAVERLGHCRKQCIPAIEAFWSPPPDAKSLSHRIAFNKM